ncbi:MAG: penicillin-binding transpeptidase domain-containing protein [Bacteroidota bacterium]
MSLKKDIVWRVGVVYIFMLILAIAVLFKIAYLQVFEGKQLTQQAEKNVLRTFPLEPNRGGIYATDGRLLATSVPYYEVRLDTRSTGMEPGRFMQQVDSLAYCLSHLFRDLSTSEYKRKLANAHKRGERFLLLKRRVSYMQLEQMKKFPLLRRGRYKGGFIILQNNIRIHPHGGLAARTIGYLSKSEQGNVVGLEGAYDDYLTGTAGLRLMQKVNGDLWMPVDDENEVEPEDGKDIITTLDVNIQDVAESALKRQLSLQGAHHGTAVLMEVATGEIKAIANLERTALGDYKETYNYAIGESTVPGSTFKLASIIAALEDGVVRLTDTIDTGEGVVYYYDQKMKDSHQGGYGKITVTEVFEKSSNVGISKIITDNYGNDPKKFINRLYRMNLNKPLGLDILGEGQPAIKYPGDPLWSGITLPMMSIGYETRLTPLQILTFYNAVANNGKMVKPKLVKEVRYRGKLVEKFPTEVINPSICSRGTLKKAQQLLRGAVEEGTARNLDNPNYAIAGKTGTAQIANRDYGYRDKSKISYQASFAGYFPADQPKYSCIVVVNAPSRNVYYGNLVAGPVFKEIADKVYATSFDMHKKSTVEPDEIKIPYTKHSYKPELLGALKELKIRVDTTDVNSNWVVTRAKDSIVVLHNELINEAIMPNVVGMGIKDALYLLENKGVKVAFKGRGTVLEQSVKPGAVVKEHNHILLKMSVIN